jgi:putative RecB family exonuclease
MTVYSHSRLGAYENCPLRYKYQYIEKPEIERRDSIEAYMGSRCHESLENLYKLLLNRHLLTNEELLDDFKARWEKNWNENIYIVRKDLKAEDYFQQGIYALNKYYDRYHPFESDKTIALEQRIEINLDDSGLYKLQGYIDRLTETEDGHYQIHDYKTERTFKSQEHFDQERQLALYQIGISGMFSDIKSVELIWHYLLFDKEARSERKQAQLDELKSNTIKLIQEVEKAGEEDDFPYKESALCDWCDFYQICPAKKHIFITEEMSPQEFSEDDGVRMVNRWAEIKEITAQLNEEKAQLEESLFQYCKQLGVEVVRGSDHKLRIKIEPAFKARHSASKDPAEKARFFQWLKEHGLYDELMMLNYSRMNSILKGGSLSEDIRAAFMEFVYVDEGSRRFYLSRLKKSDY